MSKDLINQTITIDGIEHKVVVSRPAGAGSYHVSVDKYYCGQIVKYSTGWTAFVKSEYLTSDDIDAIIERIREAEG